MKLHLGFENRGPATAVAPELQQRGINLLKAAPSQVEYKGLYTKRQPGYEEYVGNLPAFMAATATGQTQRIGMGGYPQRIVSSDLLPTPALNIFVNPKTSNDAKKIKQDFTTTEMTSARGISGGLKVVYGPGLLGAIRSMELEGGSFAPDGLIHARDLGPLIRILLILSAFFRTHVYPAFQSEDILMRELSDIFDEEKRKLEADEKALPDKRRRIYGIQKGGATGIGPRGSLDILDDVVLSRAKPSSKEVKPWGGVNDLPDMPGVCIPYLSELSNPDKFTIPDVMERYFTRCFGTNTDECMSEESEIIRAWKSSLYLSRFGKVLSHMAKCILIGLPAQARIYPVYDGSDYRGCAIYGWGFSIGNRGVIYRPEKMTSDDKDSFGTQEGICSKIAAFMEWNALEDVEYGEVLIAGRQSMRNLEEIVGKRTTEPPEMPKLRALASQLNFATPYLKTNVENVSLILNGWLHEKTPPTSLPLHASVLLENDPLTHELGSFGSICPSPTIPGTQKIMITGKEPENFTLPIAFRQTTASVAAAEWRQVFKDGFFYNGATNLSARFKNVPVRGKNRKEFFTMMYEFKKVFEEKQGVVEDKTVVGKVVEGIKSSFDLEGF